MTTRALAIAAALISALALAGCAPEEVTPEPTPTETPPAPGSIRNPHPLGETIVGDGWEVSISDVTADATEAIAQANKFNPAPPEGQRYLTVRVTLTRTGQDAAYPFDVEIAYITAQGISLREAAVHTPTRIDLLTELQPGATIIGDVAYLVHPSQTDGAVISVIPGDRTLRAYYATQ